MERAGVLYQNEMSSRVKLSNNLHLPSDSLLSLHQPSHLRNNYNNSDLRFFREEYEMEGQQIYQGEQRSEEVRVNSQSRWVYLCF